MGLLKITTVKGTMGMNKTIILTLAAGILLATTGLSQAQDRPSKGEMRQKMQDQRQQMREKMQDHRQELRENLEEHRIERKEAMEEKREELHEQHQQHREMMR